VGGGGGKGFFSDREARRWRGEDFPKEKSRSGVAIKCDGGEDTQAALFRNGRIWDKQIRKAFASIAEVD